MKFGRKPFIPNEKDLLYRNYRRTALPPIPPSFGHQNLISDWGLLGNDTVGDCVIAGADHETMLWTAEGSVEASFTAANAMSDYSAITGYNPNDPNTDQGTEVRTALQYRQKTGMIDAGGNRHKIAVYLLLDHSNLLNELLEAVYLFSAVGIGINFPDSAMEQFNNGQPWSVVQGSQIEGGHYVPVVGYDGSYIYCVTWGRVQKMTVDFLKTYCEEAWAILSQEFLNGKGVSPEGFDFAQLQADLAAITGTPIPAPVSLSSISLLPTTLNLMAEQSGTISVAAHYSDGSSKDVSQLVTYSTAATDALSFQGNTITSLQNVSDQYNVTVSYQGIDTALVVKVSTNPNPKQTYDLKVCNLERAKADALMTFLRIIGFTVVEELQ
ncbi:hypothetical protein Desaci_1863 [Desulfosporosinus acidiphilus SJ4]|uniref:Uncharacterized protein n=1 Tax=Desulfosporosinus acidiphilus (strain DSM 22704 / JCM 16185 / SJ4) TaxID=646529 RepID=I4D4W6_DESAJ|nr:hypothetical protein [Desulfosporosinus acidiphilus]AFM40840.1 hypothetical protein Desaci_1863 [Desulfosporosinus acidiphilus SJ4]